MANDITFSMTYYGQIERLQYQLDFFRNSSRELREHVTLQIINDGYNDAGLFESVLSGYDDLKIKGYKATVDVGFNNHGCRNLMMMESETHWNMLMDIDVLIDTPLLDAMINTELSEKQMYLFNVEFDHPDNPEDYDDLDIDPKKILKYKAHPNTWLMTKPCFWSGGGYDVEFTGMRHGDAEFFLSLDKDTYDYNLFHPDIEDRLTIHVRKPNRNRSYLNQATEHVKSLGRTVDFVRKRNDDKDRKFKKRLVTFPWRRVI
tara:strand:- start:2 stop:781 length:780 start_codon:yes stop_codon:yes gene_type:complete